MIAQWILGEKIEVITLLFNFMHLNKIIIIIICRGTKFMHSSILIAFHANFVFDIF